ncbi:MAG: hypothetical protein R3A13_12760, partial [Bdellovibrionota bacterium]
PCDPVGARAIDGPGCVSCRFLHPELGDTTPWTNTNPNDPLPTDRIYIHCQYQPDVFLIKPMAGMMNLILGGGFTTNPLVFDKYQVLRWYSDRLVVPGP